MSSTVYNDSFKIGLSWEHRAAFSFPDYWADLNGPRAWLPGIIFLIVLMSILCIWEAVSTDD